MGDDHKMSSWYKVKGTSQQEQDAKRNYVQLGNTHPSRFQVMAEKQATLEPQEMAARLRLCSFGRGLWLGQVLPFLAVAGVLSIIVEVWNRVAASKVPSKRPEEQVSPLRWFALGYLIVIVLQTKKFPWPTILHLSSTAPNACPRVRKCRRLAPVETKLDTFLRNHQIHVVRQPKDGYTVPRLILTLPKDHDAFQFGDCTATIPYTVEQTADVYYRKFKEPLPDPASRLLDSIEMLEERCLDEYCAVFRRRLLRFRNEAPSMIKRFVNSDFVEYIEDSLLDKQNRIFYVYVRNKSFQSLGVLEDYSVYKADAVKSHWTHLSQLCRVHILSSSLSFFRSRIESFISNFYCKNAPDARNYHLQRIREEFGEPVE